MKRILPPLLGAAALLCPAYSQTGDESEDEIFELSPFTVDGSTEEGYRATNTLAGTRLNSSIKDVASPISVFTKELMEDIGATNVQDALQYSVNVQNENEYAPDDSEGESISSTVQTRVRGLSGGTPTRGFFTTNYRTDSYNTRNITIARGPNSILFGLGSPAGVIDSTPIEANVNERSGKVSLRFDNWGGLRGSFDYNLPLVEEKLAFRFAAMQQDRKTFREPEVDDESRQYVAATYKPFKGTVLRANYEQMENDRVRARQDIMTDRVSGWIAAGAPLFDHSTGLWTLDDGATWGEIPELANYYLDADGGAIGARDRVHIAGGSLGDPTQLQAYSWRNTGLSYDPFDNKVSSFQDERLIDFDTNYYGLASMSKLKGDNMSVTFEQKIMDNLHVQLAYNRESYSRDQDETIRPGLSGITADVNYYLPYDIDPSNSEQITDGPLILNPNRGRYMVESQYLGYTQEIDLETFRGLITYQLDFNENEMGWLGRHTLGAMYQAEREESFRFKRRLVNQGDYYLSIDGQADGNNNTVNSNNIRTRYYLDLAGDPAGVPYPTNFKLPTWDSKVGPFGGDGSPQTIRNDVTGTLLVMQSRLLEDNLIFTYGYRDDKQESWSNLAPARDQETLEWIPSELDLDADPNSHSGITRTFGVVYHTPLKGVSLTYNEANTFNPQGEFYDWFGTPVPPGSGDGKDIGVSFDMLEGKLSAKVSFFEGTSLDAIEYDWYYEQPKWSLVGATDAPWGVISNYSKKLIPPSLQAQVDAGTLDPDSIRNPVLPNDSIRATRDFKSEGMELELHYKPMRQLDIRWTLAKTEATNLKVLPLLQDYVNERYPIWEAYFAYPWGGQWGGWIPNPLEDWQTNPGSIGYRLLNQLTAMPRYDEIISTEGTVTARGRKWRSNLIANYRFSDGKMKGASIGGAARYRSPETIGYLGRPNPRVEGGPEVTDITKPIEGDDVVEFDMWAKYSLKNAFSLGEREVDWTVQVNVQNLFNDDGLTPIAAFTDGTYHRFRKKSPRTIMVTNTFEF